jgi:hypothetical protein
MRDGRIAALELHDRVNGTSLEAPEIELFRIRMADGTVLPASAFRPAGGPAETVIQARGDAARRSDRLPSRAVEAGFLHEATGLRVAWRVRIADDARYLRQEFSFRAGEAPAPVREVSVLDLPAPGARTRGSVQGSPVFAGQMFFAVEHPMAECAGARGRVTGSLRRGSDLPPGASLDVSAVIGTTSPGQTRRDFLGYLERERIHPYRPFLHYNSWYDIAWPGHLMNEGICLAVIDGYAGPLIRDRGVRLDAFVFDDGWDEHRSLWGFHSGFPRGFTPLRERAGPLGSSLGVWMSPWGGYGDEQRRRVEWGKAQGFEMRGSGYALAGSNYNARFTAACFDFIRTYGCTYFKFDGIGGGTYASGAPPEAAPDLEALLHLAVRIHEEQPATFINCTVGTWPSPFWLWGADSIWRQGQDIAFAGPWGTMRDRWITYRDGEVFSRIVRRGPLFPLNSLMLHGVALAKLGTPTRMNNDVAAFRREVRNYFASGTGLQELYVSHDLLTAEHWDALAEAAKWARARAPVLVDGHWVGGNPVEGEVYGFAAWSPDRATLMLRNPKDTAAEFEAELGAILELPAGQPSTWELHRPWSDERAAPVVRLTAGEPQKLRLDPLEVAVWDASPEPGSRPYAYSGYERAAAGYAARREEFVGRWRYAWEDRSYVREFNGDGTARLLIGGTPYGGWSGFRWAYDDGEISILRPNGAVDGRHRLKDTNTLTFEDHPYPPARREGEQAPTEGPDRLDAPKSIRVIREIRGQNPE